MVLQPLAEFFCVLSVFSLSSCVLLRFKNCERFLFRTSSFFILNTQGSRLQPNGCILQSFFLPVRLSLVTGRTGATTKLLN